jgi:hypothetical protein
MNVDVKIKVIKDVGWSFMYLNSTTSKGTKKILMVIHTRHYGEHLPRMGTIVQHKSLIELENLEMVHL